MFDFFTKTENENKKNKQAKKPAEKAQTRRAVNFNQNDNSDSLGGSGYRVILPRSFEDVSKVIELLSVNKPVIVNLKEVEDGTAQRVLDILCGAVCALNGGVYELENNIYVFTPDSVNVN